MAAGSTASVENPRRVLILEPDPDGHHAFWLALLIEAHRRAGWRVDVLTSADASRLDDQASMRGFDFSGVGRHVCAAGKDAALLGQAAELARSQRIDRVFIAFVDRFWSPLLDGAPTWAVRSGGAKLAGIWFHPHALDSKWRWAPPLGKRWKVRGRVHRFLRSAGAARDWTRLFFLVEEPARRMLNANPAIQARVLPDPWERAPRLEGTAARRMLGIPEDRTVFLHLGSPERRKGLPDALAAFVALTTAPRPEWARPPLLLRVGPNDRLKKGERATLDRLRERGDALTVERFVPAAELMEYFSASDWVLIPYRKFRYSSGILANAIGTLRPVIASGYGEIGRAVAREGLGLIYPHGSAAGLARGMASALAEGPDRFTGGLKSARDSRSVDAMLNALTSHSARDDVNLSQ